MTKTEERIAEKISTLSYEELQELSKKKDKLGCATKAALMAQFVIYERAGKCFSRNHNPYGMHRDGEFMGDFL